MTGIPWLPPGTSPPGVKTHYANSDCYLAASQNCSEKISREHYLSRDVLTELGPAIGIHGFPWLAPDERRIVGIDSLTAKILCTRHNSSLSPLDQEAGRFFRALREISENLFSKSLSRKKLTYNFCGLALDMWMVKVACGLYYSNIAAEDNVKLSGSYKINRELIYHALANSRFLPGAGLYFITPKNRTMISENQVQLRPLTVKEEKRFIGFRVGIRNTEFDSLFDVQGLALPTEKDGLHYRPSELIFKSKLREHTIALNWPPSASKKIITISVLPKRGKAI
jgi:hypothetical protein